MTSDKSYSAEARVAALVTGVDTWHNLGAPVAGWSTGGFAKYMALGVAGLVIVRFQNITPPATAPVDGTVVWVIANGLAAGYMPVNNTRIPCYATALTLASGTPAFEFETDGSIQVFGIRTANPTRLDGTFILATV